MGGCGEDPNKGIDASVGGLVWVRRRNGSWWPGRIVGQDELPVGCVPAPRAGTPVKLLGREDASVDWYNLEKSKRVKPFRCGEYDDCIEKAKASGPALVSHHSKRSVKYARREEAILEALELESARLEKDCTNFSIGLDTQHTEHDVYESPSLNFNDRSVLIDEYLNCSEDESDSAPGVSQSVLSFEGKPNPQRMVNDSEDDGNGIQGAKRMRGLNDLGPGVMLSSKRKRSQVQDCLKRKNRRRALTKVLECTATVPVPGASENKVSELESNESKLNNSLVINNSDSTGISCENPTSLNASRHSGNPFLQTELKENEISSIQETPVHGSSEGLFDIPLPDEEKNSTGLSTVISGVQQKTQVGSAAPSSQSSHVETISLEHNESGSTSSGTAEIHNISPGIDDNYASKWQSKGKRNSSRCRLKSRPVMDIEEIPGWNRNAPQRQSCGSMAEISLLAPPRLLPYRQSRFTVNPKYDAFDFSPNHHIASSSSSSGLYDVLVEVKAIHRAEHVPFISLMSKISGQPIIGHPITVEALDDDDLLTLSECHSSTSELNHNLINASMARGSDIAHKRKSRGRPPRKHHRSSTKSRKNTAASKKIRRLSSLTGVDRRDETKPLVEKIGGPSVACVPLKVVFSRINAALNS